MDARSEKEKSSKRTREERDQRDRHNDRDRNREHRHRSRDGDDNRHRDFDHHRDLRSDRDSKREHSHEPRDHKSRRERSREPRDGREGSRDRDSRLGRSYDSREEREGSRDSTYDGERKRERSYEPGSEREVSKNTDELVERRNSSYSQKRKEREHSEDIYEREEKRTRVSEERKERRRFEDKVEDGKEFNGGENAGRRERRRFGDKVKKEDDIEDGKQVKVTELKVKEDVTDNDAQGVGSADWSVSAGNGFSLGSPAIGSRSVHEASVATDPSLSIKVSSISTTNENKGVSITRSYEVTGKSSTDGSSSTAGKGGSLSLDVLAKAKLALQKQKEVSEKLKKLSELKSSSNSDARMQLGSKDESKLPSHSTGVASTATSSASLGPTAFMSTLHTATSATSATPMPQAGSTTASVDIATLPNYEAVKRAQELAARMGFRQDPQFGPLINMFPGTMVTDIAIPQKPTKVPVLRLDALGREIDEHGNVVNVTKPSNLSTLKVNINKQKKEAFQILKPVLDVDPESDPHFDSSMGINKTKLLRPKRMTFQFVEEGKWSKEAETIKLKSKFGEAQAKEQKAKQAQLAKAKAAPDINPNLIEIKERVVIKEKPKEPIPEVEWWDVPLLIGGSYGDVTEGTIGDDKLKMDKITFYVEHPRPIEPPAESAPPPPQPLKLTKKEQKKLRTQRRLAKEKERQEMIRQGVIEPPKSKVKISNLMKVLGTEATQDPTRLEKEIRSAAAEREQAHIDRNIARKLTPAERREKKERKLFDDPTNVETLVSVYRLNDLSHPKARFRVDVNAQENRLTGCAVISDGISVVMVEGGSKSIKRYGKLMLRRINWTDLSKEEEDGGDSDDDKPVNKCFLVWQGSVAKPSFNRFSVHECMTESAARKIFADAGVGHYWDLAVNYKDDEV